MLNDKHVRCVADGRRVARGLLFSCAPHRCLELCGLRFPCSSSDDHQTAYRSAISNSRSLRPAQKSDHIINRSAHCAWVTIAIWNLPFHFQITDFFIPLCFLISVVPRTLTCVSCPLVVGLNDFQEM